MKPMKFGFGQPVRRVEDARFVTGRGNYTADIDEPGFLRAVLLRSPHAAASFTLGDLSGVLAMPGVRAVITHKDVAGLGGIPSGLSLKSSDGTPLVTPPYAILPENEVRHVGEAIAMVVADTEAQARDAAEAIPVDYVTRDAVGDIASAIRDGAPQVWPQAKGNVAVDMVLGNAAAVEEAFAKAHRISKVEVVNTRLIANYMEPRAAISEYDPQTQRYTLTTATQGVHNIRDMLAHVIMKVPPEQIRVVTHDVGGGFGTKSFMYREYPLLLVAARLCGRKVKWVSDRNEHFLADVHGRDNLSKAEMAMDADGRFLGLRIDLVGNLGAYLSNYGAGIHWIGLTMGTGTYDIPAFTAHLREVFTNTVPVDAYRGAGRPEAAYLIERLVEQCALDTGIAREELRARNFVKQSQMPYKTGTGRTYDVGDFEGAMRSALARADKDGFEARLAQSRKNGKLRGFGMSSYIECTAMGTGEKGEVRLDGDGAFTVLIGTQSNGQGHATAYAQTVSQQLDVTLDQVRVVQGDTDLVKTGRGTGGSRSIPVGAVMVTRASETLATQLKQIAGDELEAATGDLEIVPGAIRVAGTDRSVTYAQIARSPKADPALLSATAEFTPPDATYPNGTHVCEVEIDPETGVVEIVAYTVCDDYGATLNPLLLAGQVHGGIVQGIGQALLECATYSQDGQLVTGSLTDYCLPRADNLPFFSFETRNIPSTSNPLGLKGAGEAGTIGATPCVMNGVIDALHRAYGIRSLDMPATPGRVRAAIAAVSR